MTNLGLEVDIACNGQEAVDKVTGQDKSVYDLVLMDMHMPVLGGVEATRIIKETGKYDSLPIYALSADMFSDNLDVALDCGMAGYLEKKPISISKLTEVLQKHVKEEKPKARNVDDKQYDDSIVYGVDFEYFQKNVSSDVETLKSFLETFASMNTYFMDKLRVQIENNDFAGAGEALHSMIGASGSCGMFKLSKKNCREFSAYLINEDPDPGGVIGSELDLLGSELDSILKSINEYCKKKTKADSV